MILGIDIGGTAVKMGLVDREGHIHARHEASVSFDGYRTPVMDTVLREAEGFLRREKAAIEGVGASVAGQIDDQTGVIIGTNGKIPHYEGSRVREQMENRFGIPTRALNDANAAVLGECFTGAARGVANVVMLTLGTGVGGGVMVGGQLLRGQRGIAGELGHFTLYQDGEACPCGKRGCLESYASATALVCAACRAAGEDSLNGREIFSRAAKGDETMLRVIDRWVEDIAAGVSGLVHIFNPELVLIGGGVSAQEELLMQPLRKRVLQSVMPRFAEGLQIQRAALGNDAGMIGAVKFFIDNMQGG